jgi:hypothetical protein
LVLNRLLNGFEGKLTTSKWGKNGFFMHKRAMESLAQPW